MDLSPLLTADAGALTFAAVVLWEILKRFVIPKIPLLAPYFPSAPATPTNPTPSAPATPTPSPGPAPTPSPSPVSPLPQPTPAIPDSGRPLLDLFKRIVASAVEHAPEMLPKLLPLIPLFLEKPVPAPTPTPEKKDEAPKP